MKRIVVCTCGIVALLALCLYLYAASIQLYHVNTDPERSDQGSYMGYAIKLKESGYTYVGERNRMPLFPILSSALYREGMSEEEFFVRGKWFNVGLSVALLGLLLAVFRRDLSAHGAANLLGIVAFTLFVFKAPCFQGELLYYALSFTAFWLLSRLLVRPRPLLGLLAGVVLAAAQYTKASALPGLVFFLTIALVSHIWGEPDRRQPMLERLRHGLRAPLATAAALCLWVYTCSFCAPISSTASASTAGPFTTSTPLSTCGTTPGKKRRRARAPTAIGRAGPTCPRIRFRA